MKLALLGTGMIVKEVLPVLKEIEGIELVAILSTPRSLDKARELAGIYGLAQASSDYEDILSNPEVDTVYVGLPNHLHFSYAKKALLAGKHVICENLSPCIWRSLKNWLRWLRSVSYFSWKLSPTNTWEILPI